MFCLYSAICNQISCYHSWKHPVEGIVPISWFRSICAQTVRHSWDTRRHLARHKRISNHLTQRLPHWYDMMMWVLHHSSICSSEGHICKNNYFTYDMNRNCKKHEGSQQFIVWWKSCPTIDITSQREDNSDLHDVSSNYAKTIHKPQTILIMALLTSWWREEENSNINRDLLD